LVLPFYRHLNRRMAGDCLIVVAKSHQEVTEVVGKGIGWGR
jgi:hypothetical protein